MVLGVVSTDTGKLWRGEGGRLRISQPEGDHGHKLRYTRCLDDTPINHVLEEFVDVLREIVLMLKYYFFFFKKFIISDN